MSLPRYPSYKESETEWLKKVPVHWQVRRLKHLLSQPLKYGLNESAEDVDEANPRFIRITDIRDNGELRAETFRSLPNDVAKDYLLQEGDILLARSGATVGKSFMYKPSWGVCCFAGYLICARVARNSVLPEFAYACLRSSFYWDYVSSVQIQATIQNVSAEKYAGLAMPVPPIREQAAIVEFLERETRKIDALIEAQERLIALLAEKRQAAISHAVTRGLHPDAPMKDSGVAWLGEVPAHWKIASLKHVVSTPITDGPHETPNFLDAGVPFVSAEAISGGFIEFGKIRGHISLDDHQRFSQKYKPQLHDIYMVKSGATTGVTAIVETDVEFNIWSPLAAVRCDKALADPFFVLNSLRSRNFQEAVAISWSFGTQQNIGMGVLGDLAIALPPLEEQRTIAEFLATEIHALGTLTVEVERAITLLKERRTALITNAVTGQIDVRDELEPSFQEVALTA